MGPVTMHRTQKPHPHSMSGVSRIMPAPKPSEIEPWIEAQRHY